MKLIFFRHAIADDKKPSHSFMDDFRREITGKGRRETKKMVKRFSEDFKDVSIIFSSPLSRAIQTGEIIYKYNQDARLEIAPSLDSSSSISACAADIRTLKPGNYCFVGHEPHLTLTISELLKLDRQCIDLAKSGYVILTGKNMDDLKISRIVSPDIV